MLKMYEIDQFVWLGLHACRLRHARKKDATKLMAVTIASSNLNRFSKFFYRWKVELNFQ